MGNISKGLREKLYADSGDICELCGIKMTRDWNKETSRTINRLIPGDEGRLLVACARCVWTKNKLGSDVINYVGDGTDLSTIRRVVNDLRRAGGFPWNEEYATSMKDLTSAELRNPLLFSGKKIPPMEIVNMVSTPAMKSLDSVESDLATFANEQQDMDVNEQRRLRAEAAKRKFDEEDQKRHIASGVAIPEKTLEGLARSEELARLVKEEKEKQRKLYGDDEVE